MIDGLAQLEAIMRRQRLCCYARTPDSEFLSLPALVKIYLRQAGPLSTIPSEEAFLRAVIAKAPGLPELAVRARASRAYPGFVRQQHFVIALRTHTRLRGVHWIPELDLHGIDVLVLDNGYALGVALSIETETSLAWQAIKAHRNPALAGLEILRLNVDPTRASKVGPFVVHPLSDVWRVQDAMDALMVKRREALAVANGKVLDVFRSD